MGSCARDYPSSFSWSIQVRISLRGEHSGKRDLAVDSLLENILHGRPNFRSVAIHNPALLALAERAAGHHFQQNAFPAGIVEHLGADCLRLAGVDQQGQFVVNSWLLHREEVRKSLINESRPIPLASVLEWTNDSIKKWRVIASRRLKITSRWLDAKRSNEFGRRLASSKAYGW